MLSRGVVAAVGRPSRVHNSFHALGGLGVTEAAPRAYFDFFFPGDDFFGFAEDSGFVSSPALRSASMLLDCW